jgi:predicted NAD/FAD-dependent oxidoreductase
VTPREGPISWIADNRIKGVSDVPALTIHASAAFSRKHWEEDRRLIGGQLLAAAERWIGTGVITSQVHGWRYSKPTRIDAAPGVVICDSPPLVMAGDAFGGARVEGAVISGWDAADMLSSLI